MTRGAARTQPCSAAQARRRLEDARVHLDLAELPTAASPAAERKAAGSSAVQAGIAAADAACCAGLGRRSRTQDHRDAAELLRQIAPGGDTAAAQFGRLIAIKDAAQYGFDDLSGATLVAAQRQARALVGFAEQVVRR